MGAQGKQRQFLEALSRCRKINLDTNPLVYYFGGGEPYAALMRDLFVLVKKGSLEVVISRIVLMELLVKPIREGNLDAVDEVVNFTERTENVRLVDVFAPIVIQAAFVRADSLDVRTSDKQKVRITGDRAIESKGLAVPDCIVVATGIVMECDATITNDSRWRRTLRKVASRSPMAHGPTLLNLPPTLYLHEFVE